jgi:hypothetical protein
MKTEIIENYNNCVFEDWMNGILVHLDEFAHLGNLDAPTWMPAGSTECGEMYGPDVKGSTSIISRDS